MATLEEAITALRSGKHVRVSSEDDVIDSLHDLLDFVSQEMTTKQAFTNDAFDILEPIKTPGQVAYETFYKDEIHVGWTAVLTFQKAKWESVAEAVLKSAHTDVEVIK